MDNKVQLEIRAAKKEDAAIILNFVTELAIFDDAQDEMEATVADIEKGLFASDSVAHGVLAYLDNQPVGFAVYFYNYSTWVGRKGLYLEDLYVCPEFRNLGIGKAILKYLAQLAVSQNCGRFEWCALEWNTPAIGFYESIGAKQQEEWRVYRLTGEALQDFAIG